MSFRTNVQFTKKEFINAGEGQIGGTQGVLFIDKDTKELIFIGPDGVIYNANKADNGNRIVFAPVV